MMQESYYTKIFSFSSTSASKTEYQDLWRKICIGPTTFARKKLADEKNSRRFF